MTVSSGPVRHRVALPDAQPPRIGKIRLGHSVETGDRDRFGDPITRAIADDHFVVTADDADITSPETVAAFTQVYGPEPRQVRAMLIGATPEDNLEGAYRLYGKSKLKRRCDGDQCSERTATGGWAEKPCVCGDKRGQKGSCVLTWTLHVLLPDVPGFGVWQVDTGSEISVRRITGFLQTLFGIKRDLSGVEFDLCLVPVTVSPDGSTKTVYVLDPRAHDFSPRAALAAAGAARPGYELAAPIADEKRDRLLDHDQPDPLQQVKRVLADMPKAARDAAKSILLDAGVLSATDTTLLKVAAAVLERFGDEAVTDLDGIIRRLENEQAGNSVAPAAAAAGGQEPAEEVKDAELFPPSEGGAS